MLCSTIIPTIGRSTLIRAVTSALDQGLTSDEQEIIVIGEVGSLLDQMADPDLNRVRVINMDRRGLSIQHNIGAALAHGTYLHFLHDDDYLLPNGLKALINVAESTKCNWVVGAVRLVDEQGSYLTTLRAIFDGNVTALFAAGESLHMGHSLVRRSAFFEVGGFDPLLPIEDDRDLAFRIAAKGDFHFTECAVACIKISFAKDSTGDLAKASFYSRVVREKMFNAPNILPRMLDSVRSDVFLRGRVCRHYTYSAVLNLMKGNIWVAASRLCSGIRMAMLYPVLPQFWRGVTYQAIRAFRTS